MMNARSHTSTPSTPTAIPATDANVWVARLLSTVGTGQCAVLSGTTASPKPCILDEGIRPLSIQVEEEAPFILVRTSGTTGNAKHFLRSWHSWERCFQAEAILFGLQASDRILTIGSPLFSLTPYGLLRSIHLGAKAGHLPHPTATASRSMADALEPTVLYGPPAAILSYTQACRTRNANSTLRLILCGGVRLSEKQYEMLRNLCPNAHIIDFYGAAETSFIATTDRSADAGIATLFPGVSARITSSGNLAVRTPYAASAQVFDPANLSNMQPVIDAEGWITLDDMAEQLPEGGLRLLGRADGALNVAGRLVPVESIEAELEATPGVEQAIVFAIPNERRGERPIALLAVANPTDTPNIADLRNRLLDALPSGAIPRVFLRTTVPLPLGGPGKPNRDHLRTAYLNGTLAAEVIS